MVYGLLAVRIRIRWETLDTQPLLLLLFPFLSLSLFFPTRDISRMKLDSDRVRHFSDHSKIIPADDESDAANLPIEFRASNQTVRNARTIAEDEVQVESRCCY